MNKREITMFVNYLKSAYRQLIKNKQNSIINIIGLAVGFAGCLVISGYVIHEWSFESMHENRKQIYRVGTEIHIGNSTIHNASATAPLGQAIQMSIPEVENVVHFINELNPVIIHNEGQFKEQRIFFTDPQFLEIFTIPLIIGDPHRALQAPFSLLVDENLAAKLFGNAEAIGQRIRLKIKEEEYNFTVTGVMKNLPSNTTLKTSLIASFSLSNHLEAIQNSKWQPFDRYFTYYLLKKNSDPVEIEKKVQALSQRKFGEQSKNVSFFFQKLENIYFDAAGNISNDLNYSANPSRTMIFLVVAILLLLLASINYVNLSTVKILSRMKEVAVRKMCGSGRGRLAVQFLVESAIVTILSMVAGIFLFDIFKHPLENYLENSLTMGIFSGYQLPLIISLLILFVGLVLGGYPAFLLSKFQASTLLRPISFQKVRRMIFRQILVTLQYAITIGLISYVLVIIKQIDYMGSKDLGFDKNNMIVLSVNEGEKLSILSTELQKIQGIQSTTRLNQFPAGGVRGITTFKIEEQEEENEKMIQAIYTDASFIPTFGITLKEGRNFRADSQADYKTILLNETAVNKFNITDPIGKKLIIGGSSIEIIGVVKDFHTNSLHSAIGPTMISNVSHNPQFYSYLAARFDNEPSRILEQIKGVWENIFPGELFHYEFSNDIIQNAYGKEEGLATLLLSLCILIIIVACLGIFGLTAFSAKKSTKEIGIRKVLGATVPSIVKKFIKEYTIWILIANIFAWPVAYFAINKWLQQFVYRIDLQVWMFLFSGMTALIIAWLTVSLQTLRAATANPVDALRYE